MKDCNILFHAEYSPKEDHLSIDVKYGKHKYGIKDFHNQLALKIMNGLVKTMEYKPLDGEYTNELQIVVK